MDTSELISAAAVIAGPLAAREPRAIPVAKIQEIAKVALEIAREIENQARTSGGA